MNQTIKTRYKAQKGDSVLLMKSLESYHYKVKRGKVLPVIFANENYFTVRVSPFESIEFDQFADYQDWSNPHLTNNKLKLIVDDCLDIGVICRTSSRQTLIETKLYTLELVGNLFDPKYDDNSSDCWYEITEHSNRKTYRKDFPNEVEKLINEITGKGGA